jgi:hypothetical protein
MGCLGASGQSGRSDGVDGADARLRRRSVALLDLFAVGIGG